MSKIAFVFSGQGAQYPGMGREFYESSQAARAVFDLSETYRPGTLTQCFEGTAEELARTVNTQPCLYTVELAIAEAVKEAGLVPEAVAGFSLGEIAALTFSGMISKEDGIRLVTKRGQLMDQAAKANPGTMAAVMKLSPAEVAALAEDYGVWPVNYNSPAQTVVAGKTEAMNAFLSAVKERRGLAVPLKVSGAFHSPCMEEASEGLALELKRIAYETPDCPVYANVTAEPYPAGGTGESRNISGEPVDPEAAESAKALTALQVKSPVQWQATIEHMVKDGFTTFIEVGAGKTLTGLIKKIAPQVRAVNVERPEDLEKEERNEFRR